MIATEPNTLKLFENEDGSFEFWKNTNMPVLIEGEKFFLQKLNYMHNNPVKREYVRVAKDWLWSSAIDFETDEEGVLQITRLQEGLL